MEQINRDIQYSRQYDPRKFLCRFKYTEKVYQHNCFLIYLCLKRPQVFQGLFLYKFLSYANVWQRFKILETIPKANNFEILLDEVKVITQLQNKNKTIIEWTLNKYMDQEILILLDQNVQMPDQKIILFKDLTTIQVAELIQFEEVESSKYEEINKDQGVEGSGKKRNQKAIKKMKEKETNEACKIIKILQKQVKMEKNIIKNGQILNIGDKSNLFFAYTQEQKSIKKLESDVQANGFKRQKLENLEDDVPIDSCFNSLVHSTNQIQEESKNYIVQQQVTESICSHNQDCDLFEKNNVMKEYEHYSKEDQTFVHLCKCSKSKFQDWDISKLINERILFKQMKTSDTTSQNSDDSQGPMQIKQEHDEEKIEFPQSLNVTNMQAIMKLKMVLRDRIISNFAKQQFLEVQKYLQEWPNDQLPQGFLTNCSSEYQEQKSQRTIFKEEDDQLGQVQRESKENSFIQEDGIQYPVVINHSTQSILNKEANNEQSLTIMKESVTLGLNTSSSEIPSSQRPALKPGQIEERIAASQIRRRNTKLQMARLLMLFKETQSKIEQLKQLQPNALVVTDQNGMIRWQGCASTCLPLLVHSLLLQQQHSKTLEQQQQQQLFDQILQQEGQDELASQHLDYLFNQNKEQILAMEENCLKEENQEIPTERDVNYEINQDVQTHQILAHQQQFLNDVAQQSTMYSTNSDPHHYFPHHLMTLNNFHRELGMQQNMYQEDQQDQQKQFMGDPSVIYAQNAYYHLHPIFDNNQMQILVPPHSMLQQNLAQNSQMNYIPNQFLIQNEQLRKQNDSITYDSWEKGQIEFDKQQNQPMMNEKGMGEQEMKEGNEEKDVHENKTWMQQNIMDHEQQLAEYESMMMHPQMMSQNYPTIQDAHYEIKKNNSLENIQKHFIQQ